MMHAFTPFRHTR